MEQFNVTGMSCAACSARVEKAVKKVPGVTSCSVSLLTNSMGVEGTASPAAILSAVQEAGYGASPKTSSASKASDASTDLDALADRETPKLKRRLIASLGFLLVLMYCADILVQVAAVNAALNGFSKELLSQHVRTCVADDLRAGGTQKLDELLQLLPRLMK